MRLKKIATCIIADNRDSLWCNIITLLSTHTFSAGTCHLFIIFNPKTKNSFTRGGNEGNLSATDI